MKLIEFGSIIDLTPKEILKRYLIRLGIVVSFTTLPLLLLAFPAHITSHLITLVLAVGITYLLSNRFNNKVDNEIAEKTYAMFSGYKDESSRLSKLENQVLEKLLESVKSMHEQVVTRQEYIDKIQKNIDELDAILKAVSSKEMEQSNIGVKKQILHLSDFHFKQTELKLVKEPPVFSISITDKNGKVTTVEGNKPTILQLMRDIAREELANPKTNK